jgi:hypothetical protein
MPFLVLLRWNFSVVFGTDKRTLIVYDYQNYIEIVKMTNVIHTFLTYLPIYFCLTCFWFSLGPSSEAGLQIRQWFKFPGYGVSARALYNFIPKCTVLTT